MKRHICRKFVKRLNESGVKDGTETFLADIEGKDLILRQVTFIHGVNFLKASLLKKKKKGKK